MTPHGALPAKNARARALGNAHRSIGPRPVITVPLGALLAQVRTARGLSASELAAMVGAAPSTVTRIERSERRVSPAMLGALAAALSPDDPGPLLASLLAAAGPLLVQDSPGGVRRRERRTRRARREANRRAVAEFRAREAMHRRADDLTAKVYRLMDRPGALDDAAALEQMCALMEESSRLRTAAGPTTGPIADRLLVTTAKVMGRSLSRAADELPRGKRERPLVEPPRDAPWPVVDRYLREKARRELGVDYG